jgi:hypothetical protein
MSSWWNSSRAVYGTELRAGALCLVDHGWPVVPGTWWRDGGWSGRCAERDSVPALAGGLADASTDPAQVARWWSREPFAVLLATGDVLDVLEMPAWMGRRVARTLRATGVPAPLAATPAGSWWFPVSAGEATLAGRLAAEGVVLHGAGSWVVAPPSECADGLVHWRVSPSACGWRLPSAWLVHSAAAEAAEVESAGPQRPSTVASGARY